jgi:hypothetical protein
VAAGEIEGVSGGGHGWGYLGYDCLLLLRVCFHNGERKENNEKTRMLWFFRVPTKSLDFIRVSSFIIVPVQRCFSVEFEALCHQPDQTRLRIRILRGCLLACTNQPAKTVNDGINQSRSLGLAT